MATKADLSVHLDLTMSPSTNATLQSIANERAISVSDVFKQAAGLFAEVEKTRKSGRTIGLRDTDKKPVVEFVGF